MRGPDKSAGLTRRDEAKGRAFSGSCGLPELARMRAEASICIDFSCFVLCIKTKNEVGMGAKPRVRFTLKTNFFERGWIMKNDPLLHVVHKS